MHRHRYAGGYCRAAEATRADSACMVAEIERDVRRIVVLSGARRMAAKGCLECSRTAVFWRWRAWQRAVLVWEGVKGVRGGKSGEGVSEAEDGVVGCRE